MTDEWLAGFFDGEGCISGRSYFCPTKYVNKPRVHLQISITQKDRKILEEIQKNYGGTIYDKTKACSHIRWLGKNEMKTFLQTIAPFVICKKEQVLLALKFVETIREENLGSKGLSESVHAEREEIYQKLRVCKVVNGHNVS